MAPSCRPLSQTKKNKSIHTHLLHLEDIKKSTEISDDQRQVRVCFGEGQERETRGGERRTDLYSIGIDSTFPAKESKERRVSAKTVSRMR
jgi:hypothetical protein